MVVPAMADNCGERPPAITDCIFYCTASTKIECINTCGKRATAMVDHFLPDKQMVCHYRDYCMTTLPQKTRLII